jgi:hypothetical protein
MGESMLKIKITAVLLWELIKSYWEIPIIVGGVIAIFATLTWGNWQAFFVNRQLMKTPEMLEQVKACNAKGKVAVVAHTVTFEPVFVKCK